MTTDNIPQKTITATIKEITEALGGQGGTYHKLTTPPVGQQKYPNIYKVWDSKLLEGIKTGDTVTITLSRGRARVAAPQADKDFYWEVAGITKVAIAPSPTATDSTREPDPLDEELTGEKPKPEAPKVAPTQKLTEGKLPFLTDTEQFLIKQRSISWSVALQQATVVIGPVAGITSENYQEVGRTILALAWQFYDGAPLMEAQKVLNG